MLSEVYSSFEPLFILSSMTGLFFLKINFKTSSISISIRKKIFVYSALIVLIAASLFYSFFNSELVKIMFSVKFSIFSGLIFVFMNNLVSISSIAWIFTKRSDILKILINLSDIDDFMKPFVITIDYIRQQRKSCIIIGCLAVIVVIMGCISSLFFIYQYESIDARFSVLILNFIIYSIIVLFNI